MSHGYDDHPSFYQQAFDVRDWQGEVGIRSRKHQQMIAEYVASVKDGKKEFVTLSVEGNISSGKSTFLQGVAANCPTLQDRIHVSPAPPPFPCV